MLSNAKVFHDQSLKMLRQEIRKIKHARFSIQPFQKGFRTPKELIAMRPRKPGNAFTFKGSVQQSAGPAIGVRHENRTVFLSGRCDFFLHARRDPFGPVMQTRGETFDSQMLPLVNSLERRNFVSERPAGNHQRPLCLRTGSHFGKR